MRTVHGGPLTVLPGVAAILALLTAAVGLGVAALATGAALTLVLWGLLEYGMRREGLDRFGPANTVTLVRAGLVVAITALVVQSWSTEVPRSLIVSLSAVALALDFVDGRLARARGTVTALGAAFDMETDAFLILVLCVYVVPVAGAWVLLIGLARYVLLLATCGLAVAGRSRAGAAVGQDRRRRRGHRAGGGCERGPADRLGAGPAVRRPGAAPGVVRPPGGHAVATPERAPGAAIAPGPPGPRRTRPALWSGSRWCCPSARTS